MSGNPPVRTVDLRGTSMSALAAAIPAVARRTGRDVVVIAADAQLRKDAALHAERWFAQHVDRSSSRVREIPEGRDVDPDDLRLVGELLLDTL